MRRAKIVATFGPAIASFENTLAVLEAGVDVARMNMSHGDYSVHDNTYENVRKAAAQLSKPVAIMADLQGPKIRLGRFVDGPHVLAEGDTFTITTEDVPGTKDICSTTLKSLTEDVNVGDALLIDDGKVALRAIEVDDVKVVATVTVGGSVSNNKGINLPGVAVNVPALSEKDEDDLRWAMRRGVDMVALSFVRDASDIKRVHEIMDEEGRRVPVIAKIEKPQAVEQLHEIIDAFDAIMVARGDLGVELPLEEVPIVQKRAIELARRWAKPVIVATQVLESMIDNPRPTRAEASDCANAVLDGADAVMLSGETSVGKYPIETVKVMARIIESTEVHGLERVPPLGTKPKTRGGAITRAAVEIADQLEAKYICTFTQSGDSARRLSRLRPIRPVFAFTPVEHVWNQLALTWGIQPVLVPMVGYGGFGMDFNTTMLVAEVIGGGHSIAVALSAHTGIGTLPIVYYGNEEQKKKYLPKLATGEYKAAYCLTEPDSGSDANSAKTKATLTSDGKHYVLNGQKMWITNGGFAEIFIVFAKIDNDKNLTAFIVEKSFGGITMNEEEHKMGIKGSSTRQIFFNDCKVPVENMLSDRENGFKIAVNILNIGRIKLGVAAIGGSKRTLSVATTYAKERKQFNTAIANFGAIKHKLAEMTVKIFASESACYRAGQNIDDAYNALVAEGLDPAKAKLKSLEEFAIECAILKVHGSEVLDFVVDEGVQIYGGMGFSAEGPMDRAYRDARINRIFEGTNEINRMLTIDMLMKRAMKGSVDLMTPAMAVQKELMSIPDFGATEEGLFSAEKKVLSNLKKAGLMVAGAAAQKFMMKLSEEQEILMNLADMLIEGYAAESALLRVEKLIGQRGEAACEIEKEVAIVYLHHAVTKAATCGREAISAFAAGDELRLMLLGLKRFTKIDAYNLKAARRKIADAVIAKGGYPF